MTLIPRKSACGRWLRCFSSQAGTGGVWGAYIRTEDVNALYEKVVGQPFVKSVLESSLTATRECPVQDLNRNVLVFGGDEDVPQDAG